MPDEQYNREWRKLYEGTSGIEWEDPDENDGEWPYPTQYKRRTLDGPLADAVRRRLGAPADAEVQITEEEISGGWSEWTQETDYVMTLSCAGTDKEFGEWSQENNLVRLLQWLDEPAGSGSGR